MVEYTQFMNETHSTNCNITSIQPERNFSWDICYTQFKITHTYNTCSKRKSEDTTIATSSARLKKMSRIVHSIVLHNNIFLSWVQVNQEVKYFYRIAFWSTAHNLKNVWFGSEQSKQQNILLRTLGIKCQTLHWKTVNSKNRIFLSCKKSF